ncbi:CoA transferase [Bradyrhizobium sp. JR4.1]|uniref:CoA transferase n=1 Tax=Bradyrhizobium sp. JR4.1 TaxID=3156372 RepID=UPI00339875B4
MLPSKDLTRFRITGTTDRPLAGVKVIDIGHYVAAPLAAMILADQRDGRHAR